MHTDDSIITSLFSLWSQWLVKLGSGQAYTPGKNHKRSYHVAGKCLVSWVLSILTILWVSQSVSHSSSQSGKQVVSQPVSQPVSHSVSQSVNQAGRQSVSQASRQAASLSARQAGKQAGMQAGSHSVRQGQAGKQSFSQSVCQADRQSVSQSVRQQSGRWAVSQSLFLRSQYWYRWIKSVD